MIFDFKNGVTNLLHFFLPTGFFNKNLTKILITKPVKASLRFHKAPLRFQNAALRFQKAPLRFQIVGLWFQFAA